MELSYPTDLSEEQWELLSLLLPTPKSYGRPRSVPLIASVNAIFYIVVARCAWRMLPKDFPNWKTVYYYFKAWRLDGTWKKIYDQLVQWERVAQGREVAPSAASLDSQSVKTATPAALNVGFDAGKKIKGRKRHLMVDTLGLVMMVAVTAANISEQRGARLLFARLAALPQSIARLTLIWVDGTYERVEFLQWTTVDSRNHQTV
jgi:transposase